MLYVLIALGMAAFATCILSAMNRCPQWVSVLILTVAFLLTLAPVR